MVRIRNQNLALVVLLLSALALQVLPLFAGDRFIVLQSTTSTRNSGLLDAILPVFEAETGIEVRVVAVGTGQAIKNAENGDGDVLMVHALEAEQKFVAEGWGVRRFDLMYNDFIIIGSKQDPAGISGLQDVVEAMKKIATSNQIFVSRGDDSGTHKAELKLWAQSKVDVSGASGTWYRETGTGMGATLNIGIGMRGYVFTDRASWVAFGQKENHVVLVEGDARLFNQYGVILINPERNPRVKQQDGQVFVDWLLGENGQGLISLFQIDGQQLFFPNAH
ncbi:MAG: substrate-binding domain-containing protein [Paracoccaceae bacterium]